ncbi:MAG: hypothetical protein U1E66_04215 [Rhodospirillales bacterium]
MTRGRLLRPAVGLILAVGVAVGMALSPSAFAAATTDTLTAKEIKQALATTEQLRPLHEKYGAQIAEYAKTVKRPEPGEDHCKLTPEVKGAPGFAEMEKVVKKNGFASGEAYCRTMDQLIRAYMAVRVEEQAPLLQEKLQEARAQIEADPNMKPEEKEQLLARLTEHPALRAAHAVPEADKKLVAQFRPQLDAAFAPPPGMAPPPGGAEAHPPSGAPAAPGQ